MTKHINEALDQIWSALHGYREDCIPENRNDQAYEEEWESITHAMATLTEALGIDETAPATKSTPRFLYVCKACHSDEIESRNWVTCNTGEITDSCEDGTVFCPECDDPEAQATDAVICDGCLDVLEAARARGWPDAGEDWADTDESVDETEGAALDWLARQGILVLDTDGEPYG